MMRLQNHTFRLGTTTSMFIGLLVMSVMMGSCGGAKPAMITEPSVPSGVYKVLEIDQASILENPPTLNFDLDQNRLSGTASCNNYSGTLVLSENNNSFVVDSIMSTKMYCSDAMMAVEYKFLKYLGQPMQWVQKGDTLSLSTDQLQNTIIAIKTQDQ